MTYSKPMLCVVRAFSDVDECVNGSRCVNGTCSNTEGSYLCHCDAGYRLEPTDQTCQGKNLESKTICFLYHPPPTSSLLIGLLVCWLVGCAVCQILMSVLTWGRLFVGFGPVRTHRALTNVRCPAHLAFPEANTRLHRWAPTGTSFSRDVTALAPPSSHCCTAHLHILVLIRAVCLSLVA